MSPAHSQSKSMKVPDGVMYCRYDDEEEGHAVVECAIDAVAPLATALGSDFTEFAPTFFPVLVGFAQPESPVDLRVAILTALGVIAQGMGEAVGPFAADILDVFIASLGDDEEEACQNSAFGIGALFAAAGEAGAPLVPAALSALYDNCIARETASGGVVDNACAAVARMIMALPEVVPLDSVLPTLMGGLPLKVPHLFRIVEQGSFVVLTFVPSNVLVNSRKILWNMSRCSIASQI